MATKAEQNYSDIPYDTWNFSSTVLTPITKEQEQELQDAINNYFEEHPELKEIPQDNLVDHPSHYTWLKEKCGIEVIDIVRHLDFDLGCAMKYLLRAGHKKDASLTDKEKTIQDLEKAIWYIKDKIKMIKSNEEC